MSVTSDRLMGTVIFRTGNESTKKNKSVRKSESTKRISLSEIFLAPSLPGGVISSKERHGIFAEVSFLPCFSSGVSNLLKMKRAICKVGVDSHSQSASTFHFHHTTTFIRKVQSSLYDWIQQNTKVFQVKINQHILHNSPALGAVSLFLFLFSLLLLFLLLFWRAGVGCIEKLLSANHNKGYKNAYIHTWTKHTHE